jgi:hypothetical protein
VGFKSPTSVTTNKVYVLPATDGSATHVLQTDGSGNLSWAAASSFAPASPGEIGASTPADASFLHLNVKSASSIVKELRLHDEDNSNYVGFKSPTNVGSNRIYTLPSTDGTNGHFLQTDGTGGLSWSAAGGGGNLNDLTDVTITTPANTQVLAYNNGIWVNQAASSFAQASPGELGATTPDIGNFTDLKVKSAASTVKELQLHDQDNSNYVGFKAPTTVSTNKVWTLPSTDGTANQVLTTDGTANLSWTTPSGGGNLNDLTDVTITGVANNQFLRYADGIWGNSNTVKGYNEGAIYGLGTTGGTIAPDVTNGNVQSITLNSALTINAFTSPVAGQSLTLIINGGTAYTSITSTMKFAGGIKTLTGTAGCIDILSVYYDGTTYYASLNKGFA